MTLLAGVSSILTHGADVPAIDETRGPQLEDPVEQLPGIGPKRAALLSNLGIATLRDLLFHLPRAYQDRRHITPMAEAAVGVEVTVQGEVVSARNVRLRGRMSLAVVKLRDDSGAITATFFGRGFMANTAFKPGARGIFTGTVGNYKGPALQNPEYEMLSGDDEDRLNTGRITPVYRLTEGVTQRLLRRWIYTALEAVAASLTETLPPALLEHYRFPGLDEAIRTVHFPEELEQGEQARTRFAYEELLAIQLGILGTRAARLHEEKGWRHTIDGPLLEALRNVLPFSLTSAQDRAVRDILDDMASPRPMVRLVQGDVGCGKTIVALHAIAAAADGGFQTALMAPTEILAEQHAIHLRHLLEPLGIRVALLTGSLRGARAVREEIAAGNSHVVVGTHALIQESTSFQRLGLVIIDEQHRFGVLQRDALTAKGLHPDLLHMTATPIPRTLAITVYGGMDVTVIDELPPGRLPVKTRRVTAAKIPGLYQYLCEQAQAGFQTYVICPLIEESEKRGELKSVIRHFEELSAGPLAALRTELLHGRLDPREKDEIMQRFKAGAIDVLFSTTVIEVGIDVANATVMLIEDAAQFGLTQLHQLRGRVGRGSEQSYCFLLGEPKTRDGRQRLDVLCKCASGFDIAEQDLLLRGPGEFYGVRQAGLSDLRVADLIRDVRLLDHARRDATAMLDNDPSKSGIKGKRLQAAWDMDYPIEILKAL
jgi:ATP-dependent DNA helicase RecG